VVVAAYASTNGYGLGTKYANQYQRKGVRVVQGGRSRASASTSDAGDRAKTAAIAQNSAGIGG